MIKNYKLFLESSNQEDIDVICQKYGIENYTINSDGTIDVDGNVDLSDKGLRKLPLKFGRVTGYFNCAFNNLTQLEGAPNWVGGYFDCYDNQLTTLEGGPKRVGGSFQCAHNKLTNLVGGPEVVIGVYYGAYKNQINDFKGFPDDFEGDCAFSVNPVKDILDEFKGIPKWKVIKYIIEYDAIWNGKVIPERIEMIKDELID